MRPQDLAEALLALDDPELQRRHLQSNLPLFNPQEISQLVQALREGFIQLLSLSAQRAQYCADLVAYLFSLTADPAHQAMADRLQGMVLAICYGRYQDALLYYDRAFATYGTLGDDLGQALVKVTRIWATAHVEGYEQVIADSTWAAGILTKLEQWRDLGNLYNNLGWIHSRFGRFREALTALDTARAIYISLDEQGKPLLTNNESNRAFAFYTLGQYKESIAAAERALELAQALGQTVNMGISSIIWG